MSVSEKVLWGTVIVLAAHRLTRALMHEWVFQWLRDALVRVGASDAPGVVPVTTRAEVKRWVRVHDIEQTIGHVQRLGPAGTFSARLLSCHWCLSVWTTAGMVGAWQAGEWGRWCVVILAGSNLVGLVEDWSRRHL